MSTTDSGITAEVFVSGCPLCENALELVGEGVEQSVAAKAALPPAPPALVAARNYRRRMERMLVL
jgi:hypothetical protein